MIDENHLWDTIERVSTYWNTLELRFFPIGYPYKRKKTEFNRIIKELMTETLHTILKMCQVHSQSQHKSDIKRFNLIEKVLICWNLLELNQPNDLDRFEIQHNKDKMLNNLIKIKKTCPKPKECQNNFEKYLNKLSVETRVIINSRLKQN